MSKKHIVLSSLPINKRAMVSKTNYTNAEARRMLDLGIIEGTYITPLYKSPFGNPIAYSVRGGIFAIRNEDAKNIIIKK